MQTHRRHTKRRWRLFFLKNCLNVNPGSLQLINSRSTADEVFGGRQGRQASRSSWGRAAKTLKFLTEPLWAQKKSGLATAHKQAASRGDATQQACFARLGRVMQQGSGAGHRFRWDPV